MTVKEAWIAGCQTAKSFGRKMNERFTDLEASIYLALIYNEDSNNGLPYPGLVDAFIDGSQNVRKTTEIPAVLMGTPVKKEG